MQFAGRACFGLIQAINLNKTNYIFGLVKDATVVQ
jgi:hypothetical protein